MSLRTGLHPVTDLTFFPCFTPWQDSGVPPDWQMPEWRVEMVGGTSVLVSRRFDHADGMRVPFLSTMSMLGANDNETRSYLKLVDALRRYGAAPKSDMPYHDFPYDGPDGLAFSRTAANYS